MHVVFPPLTEKEVFDRAHLISGWTFQQLADLTQTKIPRSSTHAKGWIGGVLEKVLGADAGNLSEPDFQAIHVELKTIPVGYDSRPLESTYVCTAPLSGLYGMTWASSCVKKKLTRVLWIPLQGEKEIPLSERRIGHPLLWSPTFSQEVALQQDWEELVEMINLGQLDKINARHGKYLQLRPKAAHGRVMCDTLNEDGESIKTIPRGFYLRRLFTEKILLANYLS